MLTAAGFLLLALSAAKLAEAAPSSCSAWNATCKARCREPGAPANCANYCANQINACRKSACWTEGARYGGATHCNLKKS